MRKKPLRILLVDDDVWLTEQFTHNLLQHFTCEVTAVGNGIDAIDALDKTKPDVVILDMFMPGPNGMVLLHEMQSHGDLAHIPVIMCSNSVADLQLSPQNLNEYGVRVIVDKAAMRPSDLVDAVKRVIV